MGVFWIIMLVATLALIVLRLSMATDRITELEGKLASLEQTIRPKQSYHDVELNAGHAHVHEEL